MEIKKEVYAFQNKSIPIKKESLGQDQDLNVYLQTIVHELKSPLVSVQGFASLLFEEYGSNLPREGKRYLERIFFNLKKAEDMLSDLSEFAQVIIDEADFKMVAVDEIIEVAKEPFLFELKERRLRLVVHSNLPDIYCDANAMIQVFTNLISNAIKYSREDSEVIEIGYACDEIFHKFFVKDYGIGISAKDRNKVFHFFSRLGNKKGVSGSGLGLAIVKRIIEGHGGEIWVDSKIYKGSTFYFTLPKVNLKIDGS
ncbi:MAG: ATP-binding protein [bacterium]